MCHKLLEVEKGCTRNEVHGLCIMVRTICGWLNSDLLSIFGWRQRLDCMKEDCKYSAYNSDNQKLKPGELIDDEHLKKYVEVFPYLPADVQNTSSPSRYKFTVKTGSKRRDIS